jgi:hypothetical protein
MEKRVAKIQKSRDVTSLGAIGLSDMPTKIGKVFSRLFLHVVPTSVGEEHL